MMQKLRERHWSSNMTSRMTILFHQMNLKYNGEDVGDYLDTYSSMLDKMETMDRKISDEVTIVLFLLSMDGGFNNIIHCRDPSKGHHNYVGRRHHMPRRRTLAF